MANKFLKNISRILVGSLFIFELLSGLGVFNRQISFTWLGLLITILIIWIPLEFIFRSVKDCLCFVDYPIAGAAMLLATAAIYLDAFGDIFKFYSLYPWYDQVAHFCGGAAAGSIIFPIFYCFTKGRQIKISPFLTGLISLAFSTSVGVIYELEEYFEDYFTGSHRLGDGPDTANDLFLDIMGALLLILFVAAIIKYRKRKSRVCI